MPRAEKAERVRKVLDELYPDTEVPLQHEDEYTLLVAVLLSAQCTDVKVNQIAPKLFARASTPEEMAKLRVATIRSIIKPCGLSPQKSKAIRRLSDILFEDLDGLVAQTFEELEALPGVGH